MEEEGEVTLNREQDEDSDGSFNSEEYDDHGSEDRNMELSEGNEQSDDDDEEESNLDDGDDESNDVDDESGSDEDER